MKYYLAYDIGGTYIKHAIISQDLTTIRKNKLLTPNNLNDLLIVMDEILNNTEYEISGIGVSAPGKVDTKSGVIYMGGSLPFLHGFSVKKFFEEKYQIATSVFNDAKAAVTTELWLGNLQGEKNAAAIILGTGVGGGIVINGDVYQGSNFQAGEFSFMLNNTNLSSDSPFIGQSASAVNFIKEANKILGTEDLNDGERVFNSLEDNRVVREMFEKYCNEVAVLIINLQAILDISKVVIGGGISNQKNLINEIVNSYEKVFDDQILLKTMLTPLEITACAFKNDANLIGTLYPFLKESYKFNKVVNQKK